MMRKIIDTENAVSPVVGVMLMLVATIIIAAVVSGYAGGLMSGSSKAPQVAIQAQYSQSSGFSMTHQGGDTLSTSRTQIIVSPTGDFGTYEQLKWVVNTSVVKISRNNKILPWFDPNLYSSSLARTFQPGETAFVNVTDLTQFQPGTYSGKITDANSTSYGFTYSTSQGQRFNLMLVDDTGKTIAQTVVTIQP